MAILTLKKQGQAKKNEKIIKNVVSISIARIKPNPHQPRKYFDRESLNSLAKSIGQVGILQPVLVRRMADESYQLVSGERRLKAARIAGLKRVPCIVLGLNERKSSLFAATENLQRKDVDLFDEAIGISKMIDVNGMTREDAAISLGISDSEVKERLSLLNLSDDEKSICKDLKLDKNQILSLSRVDKKELRLEALERLARGTISSSEIESIEKIVEGENQEKQRIRKNSAVLGNYGLFLKTINKAVEILNNAGGSAVIENIKADRQTMLVITVNNS